jgi:hypothetical protein
LFTGTPFSKVNNLSEQFFIFCKPN